jgi:LysW-gamma-L-lysine carboxypeptidase
VTDREAIDLLEALVSIPSPSGEERAAAGWLVDWMNAHGFAATVDAVGNAVGHRGSGARRILLLSHIDTFPGQLPVHRNDDTLTGRGTVDAKGALCAFAAAAAAVEVADDWQISVVGAVEEEAASSRGARHLLAGWNAPEVCIIGEPSGWDRITLGYKGRLMVDLRWRAPFSHSAGRGALPAEQAVAVWNAVVAYCDTHSASRCLGGHDAAGQSPATFDRLDASLRHIATRDDGAWCEVDMTIGLRLPPHVTPTSVAVAIQRTVERCGLNLTTGWGDDRPVGDRIVFYAPEVAYRSDKNTALVRACLAGIRAIGGQPRFVVKTGTSDMNVVGPVWNVPIVAYGPGDSALDHTPDEHISLAEYLRSIAVLRHALVALQQ